MIDSRLSGDPEVDGLLNKARAEYAEAGRGRGTLGWLWLLLVPAGFGVYLFINWWVLGDPRAFLDTQGTYWYKSLTWLWVGVGRAWNS